MDRRPIPLEWYQEAITVIFDELKRSGITLSVSKINNFLKSYVTLGQDGKISDWDFKIPESTKDLIIAEVLNDNDMINIPESLAYTILDIIGTQASYGKINPAIARPGEYQKSYQAAIDYSNATSPKKTVGDSFNDVFSGIGTAIKSLFSGIGLNLPVLIIVIVIILVFIKTRK